MTLASVVSVGARTPLGLDAPQTAFSVRAGMPAMREAALVDAEGEQITMCFLPTLDPRLTGAARALALAGPALAEALDGLGLHPGANTASSANNAATPPLRARLALCLDEDVDPTQGGWIASDLVRQARQRSLHVELEVSARGPAGPGYLLPALAAALTSGQLDLAILGGVHTDYDPARIARLERAGRLFRPPDHLSAVLPGEGAAFVVLADPAHLRRLAWKERARLLTVATGFEEARPDNDVSAFRATGLTAAVRSALAPFTSETDRVGWILTDLGFETFRHFEHQAVLTRTQAHFGPPQHIDSPAQRLGHLGAAVVPLHLALGVEGFRRGHAPHHRLLSLSGSDGGERAAMVVTAPAGSNALSSGP
ncbi:hypothetical protein [Chondromyces crocatus]|uniref:Beta-ketoacyl synthase N-terminal domain-containing protein n=1 Tax=Chondromyces crocatus TaxID=52 RepID=A0A0K1E836_CHOCO|nr:hypothetical protein [Chondromyces crocatus]AKT37025.1 uncharacterized protein CMC5_011510 [Chondromyces crocatus]